MDVVDDVLQFYYSPPLSALTNRIFTRSVSHSVSVEWQRIYRVENGQKWTTNGRVQTPASGDHKMRAKETERQMNVLAFLLTPPLSGYFAKGGYYIKRIFEAKHNQISFFLFLFSWTLCARGGYDNDFRSFLWSQLFVRRVLRRLDCRNEWYCNSLKSSVAFWIKHRMQTLSTFTSGARRFQF